MDRVHRPRRRPPDGGPGERGLGTLRPRSQPRPGPPVRLWPSAAPTTLRGERDGRSGHWKSAAPSPCPTMTTTLGTRDAGASRARETAALVGTSATPGRGSPPKIRAPCAWRIACLPVVHRSLQRFGVRREHRPYESPARRPLGGQPAPPTPCLSRRAPRALRRLSGLEPERPQALEGPDRTRSRPALPLWAHRHAIQPWRHQGRPQLDAGALLDASERRRGPHGNGGSHAQRRQAAARTTPASAVRAATGYPACRRPRSRRPSACPLEDMEVGCGRGSSTVRRRGPRGCGPRAGWAIAKRTQRCRSWRSACPCRCDNACPISCSSGRRTTAQPCASRHAAGSIPPPPRPAARPRAGPWCLCRCRQHRLAPVARRPWDGRGWPTGRT
jgi:hypothetical protein